MKKAMYLLVLIVVSSFAFSCDIGVNLNKIDISSNKKEIIADGVDSAIITAIVPDAVSSVSFFVTGGSAKLSSSVVKAVDGLAEVEITPLSSSITKEVEITAAYGLNSASTTITAKGHLFDLLVNSISSCGMRLLHIKFNQEVEIASAENIDNYEVMNNKIKHVNVLNAKLFGDQRTVQLFVDEGTTNDDLSDYLNVKNVKTLDGRITCQPEKEFLIMDVDAPRVTSIGHNNVNYNEVSVHFSEALSGISTEEFELDGEPIKGWVEYPYNGDYMAVMIHFNDNLSIGAHTISVGIEGGIKDFNVPSPYTLQPAGYVVNIK